MTLQLMSVQTGQVRKVKIQGRSIGTAFHKTPVQDAVPVGVLGLLGDEQADPTVHGGLAKAIYAYPSEHYAYWRQARLDAGVTGLDAGLAYGALGENLTLSGLIEADVWVGDILQFPHCALRVTDPREPCFKFNAAMGFNTAGKLMAQTGFCGFYLAVEEAGSIQAGQGFSIQRGTQQMAIPERFQSKMFKHLRH